MNSSSMVKECSCYTKEEWDNLLYAFSDYNLYQSYGWGEAKREMGWNVLRLACFQQDQCIGLLQALYRYYKLLGAYIGWVPGGPIFNLENKIDLDAQKALIEELRHRFSKRRYYLRIYPMQKYSSQSVLSLRSLGFSRPMQIMNQSLTYHIDTLKSESELISNLTSNWRHNLNRSQKKDFCFDFGDNKEDLLEFYGIYQKMAEKNKMRKHYSLEILAVIKNKLLPSGKMLLFLCRLNKKVISGRIVCITGKKAYDLLAATSEEGRKKYAAYFLFWHIVNWCRQNAIEYFDLSGVDPLTHEGIFNFKKGTGAELVEYVGEWEYSNSWLLRMFTNFYIGRSLRD